MPYDTNLKTAMTGNFGSGPDDTPDVQKGSKATHGPLEDGADVRDILTAMVGKGYTDFSSPDVKNYLSYLSNKIGVPAAQKIFTNIFLFNQRDDMKFRKPLERVDHFYGTSFNDRDVNNIVKGAASLGNSDPISAARTTAEVGNMQLTGRLPETNGSGDIASENKIKKVASQTIKY